MITRLLRLTAADIDALAHGRPGPALLSVLRDGQRSKRRLLLFELRRALRDAEWSTVDAASTRSIVDDALDLLDRAARQAPEAVDEIIARPLVNAAVVACLPARTLDHAAAAQFLGPLAGAAGLRAGLAFELPLATPGGRVYLPAFGSATGLGGDRATLRADGVGFTINGVGPAVSANTAGWRPARTVDLTEFRAVAIEDLDPARDCFGYEPAPYLGDAALTGLTGRLAAAWQLIEADYPDVAAIARTNLKAVVPLSPPLADGRSDSTLSASSRLAYGCVAVSDPGEVPTLALTLLHEVRHMTLGGALDLADLYVDEGTARHHAPWRLDPRPVGALLQGTYAHIGVTDFWRVHRRRSGPDSHARDRADFEFAYWRELTHRAVGALARSGELTDLGSRFVDGLASATEGWWREPVPAGILSAARDVADAGAVLWRVMNQQPEPGSVVPLQRALDTRSATTHRFGHPVIQPRPATPAHRRGISAAIRELALRHSVGERAVEPAPAPAELAVAATQDYRDRISRDPDDDEAWVGLTLALSRAGVEPAATVLSRRPDLVRELYKQARPDGANGLWTPDELAAWLAPGLDCGDDPRRSQH